MTHIEVFDSPQYLLAIYCDSALKLTGKHKLHIVLYLDKHCFCIIGRTSLISIMSVQNLYLKSYNRFN